MRKRRGLKQRQPGLWETVPAGIKRTRLETATRLIRMHKIAIVAVLAALILALSAAPSPHSAYKALYSDEEQHAKEEIIGNVAPLRCASFLSRFLRPMLG